MFAALLRCRWCRGSLFRGGNAVDDVEVRPSHGDDEVDDDGDAYLAKRQKQRLLLSMVLF